MEGNITYVNENYSDKLKKITLTELIIIDGYIEIKYFDFYIFKKNKKIYKIRKYSLEVLEKIRKYTEYSNYIDREIRKRKLKEIFG